MKVMNSSNITGIPEKTFLTYGSGQGVDIISHAFAVRNSVDYADYLQEVGKITKEEFNNIKAMLTSPDKENFEVAVLALEQLGK
jgi:hypothetical protein